MTVNLNSTSGSAFHLKHIIEVMNEFKTALTSPSVWFKLSFLFLFNQQELSGQVINGPSEITPGKNYTFTWQVLSGSDASQQSWDIDNPGGGSTGGINWAESNDATSCIYAADITSSRLNFTIRVDYRASDGLGGQDWFSTTKVVTIKPYIGEYLSSQPVSSTEVFYPGDSKSYKVVLNAARSFCNYLFVVTDQANSCVACTSSYHAGDALTFNCPSTNFPTALHNSGAYVIDITQSCSDPVQSNLHLDVLTIPIKLQNPSISGLNSISCSGDQTDLIYQATYDQAASYYVWILPPGWTYNSTSNNSNQISVKSNGTSVGEVKVQAFAANGSQIKSGQVAYPISCCPAYVPVTANVNSPNTDTQQSAGTVEASNVVNSGANAMYHAGSEVRLIDGFNAVAGSYFHAYIQGCTTSYNRSANADTLNPGSIDENTGDLNQITEVSVNTDSKSSDNARDAKISIFPNPSNSGIFEIKNKMREKLDKIKVFTATGVLIKELDSSTNIDISELEKGIYILEIFSSIRATRIKLIYQ